MKKSKKNLFVFGSFVSLGVIAVSAIGLNARGNFSHASAAGCSHVGNHYDSKLATDTSYGIKEYWVCCACHEHYLSLPSVGQWTDAGTANITIDSSDDRYLAPYSERAISSLDVTNYTSELTFGRNYTFDGTVTAHYADGETRTITGYNVDYSGLDRYSVGTSSITISAGGATKDVDITVKKSNSLKVLMIGNSFSEDTAQWANQIARSMGLETVKISNLVIGGCSLATHYNNIVNDLGNYIYYNYVTNWTTTSNYRISDALDDYEWDFITIQQVSQESGRPDSYGTYVQYITNYLKQNCINPNVNVVWNMTWAYQADSTHSGFTYYNNNQTTMYNAIVSTVQDKVVGTVDAVIPNGTAIQNYRTSYYGDTLTRDGFHLNLLYGRYTAGLTMVSALTGHSPSEATYVCNNMSSYEKEIAVESATNALSSKFAVTTSTHSTNPFSKLEISVFHDGYYYNINESGRIRNGGTSLGPKFTATQLFRKDQLPEGSIIRIASGYQIRPERFTTSCVQNVSKRLSNITSSLSITDAWWGEAKLVGFNISKTDGSALDYEEAHKAIEITVPTSALQDPEDIYYLDVVNIATWSNSQNPEIAVQAYGITDSDTVFAENTQTSTFPSWMSTSTGTSGVNVYGWISPISGVANNRSFLFRINNKVNGMTLSIKKGVTFEQNGRKYQFVDNVTMTMRDNIWSVENPITLGVKNVVTWDNSGNFEFSMSYPAGAKRIELQKVFTEMPGVVTVTNSTLKNVTFLWGYPKDSVDYCESVLVRVNEPNAAGVAVSLKGMTPFTINGFTYQFDRNYTFSKTDGVWDVDLELASTLSVTGVYTWPSTNPEIAIHYANEDKKFTETEIISSTLPSWFTVTNGTFSNYVIGFIDPKLGQSVEECILFRVNNKVAGTTINILKNKSFVVDGKRYAFENNYTLTYDGTAWSLALA